MADKEFVVEQLVARSMDERAELRDHYYSQYETDLVAELKSKFGRKSEHLMDALMKNPAEFDAWALHNALAASGGTMAYFQTDENVGFLPTRFLLPVLSTADDLRCVNSKSIACRP